MTGPSESLIKDLAEKAFRDEFVADQVKTRIALMIRVFREQAERRWSQAELGRRMGKPQNVISRLEDPDYGKMSLQTLLETAAAFDLPLWIDMPEWVDWLNYIKDVPSNTHARKSFNQKSIMYHSRSPVSLSQQNSGVVPRFENRSGLVQDTGQALFAQIDQCRYPYANTIPVPTERLNSTNQFCLAA